MHLFLLFLSRSLDIIRYRKCQPYNICLYYQVTWQGSNSRLTGINQLCVRYTVTGGLLFFSWAKHLPSLLRPGWLSNIISETDKYKYAFKKRFTQLKLKGWVLTCIKNKYLRKQIFVYGYIIGSTFVTVTESPSRLHAHSLHQ